MPRSRNLFDPTSDAPYKLSRSKLELFLNCPTCFYLDRRLGIGQPSGPPFTLNNVVDFLLKREFDAYRMRGDAHPLMRAHQIKAVPFQHADLEDWRNNRKGIQVLDAATNFLFYGAIDDVWVDPKGILTVVDYKATGSEATPTLDDEWKNAYKRQMEIYQWLLRHKGFDVSSTGYFVYVHADKNKDALNSKLEFRLHLLPYEGDDSWVSGALLEAHRCLMNDEPPSSNENCEWCGYRRAAATIEKVTYEDPQRVLF